MIILFMILFIAGASLFLTFANNNLVNQQANSNTIEALREAKDILISYAVLHGDYYGATGAGPGHLMCPDTNNNGSENTPCANNAIGRLPVSVTLPSAAIFPLSDFENGLDQQIWFALANPFRRSPATVLNSSSVSPLTIDGQGAVAAVLIAPGSALAGQSRPSNNSNRYLEVGNAGGPNYVTSNPADPENFNDRVLPIFINEIMSPVTARVAETIKIQLDNYHASNGNYPADLTEFNTAVATAPAWFAANAWGTVASYNQLTADTGTVVFAGCNITYTLDNALNSITKTSSQC